MITQTTFLFNHQYYQATLDYEDEYTIEVIQLLNQDDQPTPITTPLRWAAFASFFKDLKKSDIPPD